LPIYLLQNCIEIAYFFLIRKPSISKTYVLGWVFNIKNIHKILKERKKVQLLRRCSDKEILQQFYFGLGKFKHLLDYYSKEGVLTGDRSL
jgi:hypothetical protein